MTDHTLTRADEVLTELVELVETARNVPMSSSCVLPREHTLDLLDTLRELLPPEMAEARQLVAQRDRLLAESGERAAEAVRSATEQAETLVADARAQAEELVSGARVQAHELLEAARAEQAQLVSAASVQQAAVAEAERLRQEVDSQAAAARASADEYADRLAADAQAYAGRTLAELVDTLQRLLVTAENGRDALQRPRD